jgi:hypothetical protein
MPLGHVTSFPAKHVFAVGARLVGHGPSSCSSQVEDPNHLTALELSLVLKKTILMIGLVPLAVACGHDPSSSNNNNNSLAITGLQAEKWTWVPFADAKCRDGSSTGIAVNPSHGSDKLMIFLQGGGACFNATTCGGNPSSFSAADFTALDVVCSDEEEAGHKCNSVNSGILDRSNPANPVKDWNYVFVPYCTGDVHGGNNPAGSVAGVAGTQQFVGYVNIGLYLARLVPTFPGATRVLLTGVSAGGFGSVAAYEPVARAFASAQIDMIDDSGPPMSDPYFAGCLQDLQRQTWGLDHTLIQDCGGECSNLATRFLDLYKHQIKTHPAAKFGQVESTDDNTTTSYFGFGFNSCMGYQQLSEAQFTAGLQDMESRLSSYSNAGAFVFSGSAHTSLQSSDFYARTAGGGSTGTSGVVLNNWVRDLLNDTVTNVGP